MTNTDMETGIRYGYISANSLDPDLVCEMQSCGFDVRYEEARDELWDAIKRVCKDYMQDNASDLVADVAVEELSEAWHDNDEPIHEGTIDGVKWRTSWLGGALHVWIFKSPHLDYFQECSPCVPRAANLNCQDFNGVLAYDVPKEWRDGR